MPREVHRLKDVERAYLNETIESHRVFKLVEQSVEVKKWIIDNPLQTGGKIKSRKTHRKKKSQRQR